MSSATSRVFIVDDDPSVRRGLARLLASAGYSVQTFASALDFLQSDDADAGCLLLDVRMAGITGFDLYERLKEQERRLKVIFITGDADAELTTRGLNAGALAVLAKPFDEAPLLDAVRLACATEDAASALRTRRQGTS